MSDVPPQTAAPNAGVKRGLPAWSLKVAESDAEKLWEIARNGSVNPNAFAVQIGLKKASGGTWSLRLALLRVFGLVKATNESIKLSPTGLDVVQKWDAEKREAARRKSFFKCTAYASLVDDYDGSQVPGQPQLASRLQYEYGKTPEKASESADAFIESLKHAGLLDSDGIVRKAGAGSAPASIVATPPTVDDDADIDEDLVEDDLYDEDQDVELLETSTPGSSAGYAAASSSSTVGLNVTLDLSRFRAEEVIAILSALGLARSPRA